MHKMKLILGVHKNAPTCENVEIQSIDNIPTWCIKLFHGKFFKKKEISYYVNHLFICCNFWPFDEIFINSCEFRHVSCEWHPWIKYTWHMNYYVIFMCCKIRSCWNLYCHAWMIILHVIISMVLKVRPVNEPKMRVILGSLV